MVHGRKNIKGTQVKTGTGLEAFESTFRKNSKKKKIKGKENKGNKERMKERKKILTQYLGHNLKCKYNTKISLFVTAQHLRSFEF